MRRGIAIYYRYSNTGMKTQIPGFKQNQCDETGSEKSWHVSQVMEKILKTVVRSVGKRFTAHWSCKWRRKQKKAEEKN